jgi:hypothetical protein
MTLLEQLLSDELRAYAAVTVTSRDVDIARRRLHERIDAAPQRRARRPLMVAAVGIAVVLGIAWWLSPGPATIEPVGVTPSPSATADVPGAGFNGLPPEGAIPSSPESGELVLELVGRADPGAAHFLLFADGRLISYWFGTEDLPAIRNGDGTGWLEQRLTPEGVELLRTTFLTQNSPVETHTQVRALDNGRLQYLHDGCSPTTQPCTSMLTTMMTAVEWLPAAAWSDKTYRAYVPSNFAVCFYGGGERADGHPLDGDLEALPPTVSDLLRTGTLAGGPNYSCPTVTTEQARAIVRDLERAGIQREARNERTQSYLLNERVIDGRFESTSLDFASLLPDGDWRCVACG